MFFLCLFYNPYFSECHMICVVDKEKSITPLEPQNFKLPSRSCYQNFTHTSIWQCTLCRRKIAGEIQVTRVKYYQYTLCILKVLAKWLKLCRL